MPSELIDAAAKAHADGRLDDAESLARRALDSQPDSFAASLLIGIVSVKKGQQVEAIPALLKAHQLDVSSYEPPFWLSLAMRNLGRKQEALAMAEDAAANNPTNGHVQNQLGMCLLDSGRPDEAVQCFLKAIDSNPKVAPFFDNLGMAFQALGRNEDAIIAFRQVVTIGPPRAPAFSRLGEAFLTIPDTVGAAQCAREIIRLEPSSPVGYLLHAKALIAEGRVEEGSLEAQKAIELGPNKAGPIAYYGRALQALGEIEEADVQFRRSIELEPNQGFAYHALVHNRKVTEQDRPLVEKMMEVADTPALSKRELIQLEYGLGKALEDLGDYGGAMSHFDRANLIDHELKVGVRPFDPDGLERTISFLTETFTKEFIESHKFGGGASTGPQPLFVVGMMRSGTTLAEQILSSHPLIAGAGEQLFWPENAGLGDKLFSWTTDSPPRLDPNSLDARRLHAMAFEYLAILEKIAPDKALVVDKMNTNYLLLGLLLIAFPRAKIVHMMRSPLDTCISIWATPVAYGIDLCGSKENVVFAYEQYLRLMAHWRSVLPAENLLNVQYEELVCDQGRVTREMIAFCGLPWDDACLRPERNKRPVKTPSVWQVRQPVYKTSLARWKKFESYLGAFSNLERYERS